jgi:hypothetical protein
LAELTSLEEMMRIMSEEEQIHQDIISKLWQIYSMPTLHHGSSLLIHIVVQVLNKTFRDSSAVELSSYWACLPWEDAAC